MRRTTPLIIVTALALLLVGSAHAEPVPGESKLRPGLSDALVAAAPNELVPISIVPAGRAAPDLDALDPDKAKRRAAVVAHLKASSLETTRDLLAWLEAELDEGRVGPRIRSLWLAGVVATSATPDVIRRLAARDDVAAVNHDRRVGPDVLAFRANEAAEGDALECGVARMRTPAVWNELGVTGRGVVIAYVDTGCCVAHPDLAGQIWRNPRETPGNGIDDDGNGYVDDVIGWNFRDETNDPFDDHGHGTHVAGTLVGDGTSGEQTGMAPGARLMVLKFWNSFSAETLVWEAMQYAVDNGADVLSGSLGWPHAFGPDRATWRAACENAISAGVICVFAAGNEGMYPNPPDEVRTPGDVPSIITVGATDCLDVIAPFSSNGPVTWQGVPEYGDWPYPPGLTKPTISAPGRFTRSTKNDCTGYTIMSGTSMATPHVAGTVALMLEADPSLEHAQVRTILEETAHDLGVVGADNEYGAGRVDAYRAVRRALRALPCAADLDASGDVGFTDLVDVLTHWGPCPACPQDLDASGDVGLTDLHAVLTRWGPC